MSGSNVIEESKQAVADLWRQSARNALLLGQHLETLRIGMPAREFSEYVRNDLARMGMSRATAYRFIALKRELKTLFPNVYIHEAVIRLTNGRGIFAASAKGVQPPSARLTPAAQDALWALPCPPEEEKGVKEADAWAAAFVQGMKKARARRRTEELAARKTDEGQAKQRQSLLSVLQSLAAGCSPEALREFRDRMNQILDDRGLSVESGKRDLPDVRNDAFASAAPPATASQSQVGTESPSPDLPEKAAAVGAVKTEMHLMAEDVRTASSPTLVDQSTVSTAKPSQSQLETEIPIPAAQAEEVSSADVTAGIPELPDQNYEEERAPCPDGSQFSLAADELEGFGQSAGWEQAVVSAEPPSQSRIETEILSPPAQAKKISLFDIYEENPFADVAGEAADPDSDEALYREYLEECAWDELLDDDDDGTVERSQSRIETCAEFEHWNLPDWNPLADPDPLGSWRRSCPNMVAIIECLGSPDFPPASRPKETEAKIPGKDSRLPYPERGRMPPPIRRPKMTSGMAPRVRGVRGSQPQPKSLAAILFESLG